MQMSLIYTHNWSYKYIVGSLCKQNQKYHTALSIHWLYTYIFDNTLYLPCIIKNFKWSLGYYIKIVYIFFLPPKDTNDESLITLMTSLDQIISLKRNFSWETQHLRVHSSNDCNSQSWPRLKLSLELYLGLLY